MKRIVACVAVLLLASAATAAADPDWKKVGEALGKEGSVQPGGVYKVGLPRTDLHVTLDGVDLKPSLALGSWIAFEPAGNDAMVMGDLVLTEQEVNPVMAQLTVQGIQVTAIHNHLLRATPATFYMHILGHGDPVNLARRLHDGLALSKTPFATSPAAPPPSDLDAPALDKILGAEGKPNGGVLQYGVARAEHVTEGSMAVPPAMGTAVAINFQPTGGGKAAITGDFVLTADEIQPVMRALREHDIEVTALHNHMTHESPRLFFMHFWANDDALKLARGLRVALDRIQVARG